MIDNAYKNSRGDTYTLYIKEYHGEYPPPNDTDIPKDKEGFSARILTVWDTYNIEQLLWNRNAKHAQKDEAAVEGLLKPLLKRIADRFEGDFDGEFVYEIRGNIDQLTIIFTKWVHSVTSVNTGGDCDTFDYHPSALQALYDFAIDLDDITRTRRFTKHLAKAYKAQDARCHLTECFGDCVFRMPKKHPKRQKWQRYGR